MLLGFLYDVTAHVFQISYFYIYLYLYELLLYGYMYYFIRFVLVYHSFEPLPDKHKV